MIVSLSGPQDRSVCFLQTFWNCLRILNRIFNIHLNGFLLRTTKQEWKSAFKRREALSLSRNPSRCGLQQADRNTLQQVKMIKLVVVFTSDERPDKEIDTRMGKANTALRGLYRSVVTNREISNTARLSVVKSVNVPTLTCCHQCWVMAESVLSKVQAGEVSFFRRIHRMTFRESRQRVQLWN